MHLDDLIKVLSECYMLILLYSRIPSAWCIFIGTQSFQLLGLWGGIMEPYENQKRTL